MHYHVYIATERKEAILDPQGKATHHALDSLGMSQVADVRIGKFIRLSVNADSIDMAQAVALTLLVITGHLTVPWLIGLAVFLGCVTAIDAVECLLTDRVRDLYAGRHLGPSPRWL